MLQDIGPLVSALKKAGFRVQIETNGTIFRPVAADRITVSPKPPGYGAHPSFLRRAAEVKLVVSRDLSLPDRRPGPEGVSGRNARFTSNPSRTPPGAGPRPSVSPARRVRAGLKNVRLSLQLHKVYGMR